MSETDTKVARHLTLSGNVQGVFFRSNTEDRARERGVSGWVRNNPDGTVEAWLEGAEENVSAVESWITGGGPPRARVEDVRAETVEPEGHDGFRVKH